MSSARLSAILAGLFIFGALPLLFIHPAGSAGVGLSAGFLHPLESVFHIFVFLCVGFQAAKLGREAMSMLPLSFVLMLGIGLMTEVGLSHFAFGHMLIFAVIMLFAMAVSLGYTRAFMVCASVTSAFAFYIGAGYASYLPDIASATYYLMGLCVSTGLVVGAGLSASLTLAGNTGRAFRWFRRIPAVAVVLGFF
jgi:urease accessory protein